MRISRLTVALYVDDLAAAERLFQVTDPNGVTVQLVEWLKSE